MAPGLLACSPLFHFGFCLVMIYCSVFSHLVFLPYTLLSLRGCVVPIHTYTHTYFLTSGHINLAPFPLTREKENGRRQLKTSRTRMYCTHLLFCLFPTLNLPLRHKDCVVRGEGRAARRPRSRSRSRHDSQRKRGDIPRMEVVDKAVVVVMRGTKGAVGEERGRSVVEGEGERGRGG